MSSRANHARTKEKKKQLRLKNFHKRVRQRQLEKLGKMNQPKGRTINLKGSQQRMRDFAVPYEQMFPEGGWFPDPGKRYPNQRQQRKRMRQSPYLRKKLKNKS